MQGLSTADSVGFRARQFETLKRTMKIDQHPFATNMVDMTKEKSPLQAKILTSSSAKKQGVVVPKVQITVDEVHRKRPNTLRHRAGVSRLRCC